MKKKILWWILIPFVCAFAIEYYWGKTIFFKIAKTILSTKYQLQIEAEKFHFGMSMGKLVLKQARITDQANESLGPVVKADRIDIDMNLGSVFRQKAQFDRLRAVKPAVELNRTQDGALQLAQVVQRFQSKSAPEDPQTSPSKKSFPQLIIEDATFQYKDGNSPGNDIHTISIGELQFDPTVDRFLSKGLSVHQTSDQDRVLLQIDSLRVDGAFQDAATPIGVHAKGIVIKGEETEPDQYDFKQSLTVWRRVIEEITAPFKSDHTNPPRNFAPLSFESVSIEITPAGGQPGAIRIHVDQISLTKDGAQLTLDGVLVEETNQPAVQCEKIILAGVREQELSLQSLQLKGLRVEIRHDAEGRVNLNRAAERILNVIQSLLPLNEDPTKVSTTNPFSSIKHIHIMDSVITLKEPIQPVQHFSLEEFLYESNNRTIMKDAAFTMEPEANPYFAITSASVVVNKEVEITQIDEITADALTIHIQNTPQGMDVSQRLKTWDSMWNRLQKNSHLPAVQTPSKMFRIQSAVIQDARVEYTDTRLEQPTTLVFDPVTFHWRDFQIGASPTKMTPFTLSANMISPTQGTFLSEGTAASSLKPVNLKSAATISIQDLTALETYYIDSMPVGIEKAGLRIEGDFNVTNNEADCVFTLTLIHPEFTSEKGKWNEGINKSTAITALNNLKNKNGEIIFYKNRLRGDVHDPNFKPGAGVFNILGRNLWNGIKNIPGLFLNVVKTGGNVIKKTAGSVGNAVRTIIGKKKNE